MAACGTKTCASRFGGAQTNGPHGVCGEAVGSVHKSSVKIRKLQQDSKFVTQSFSDTQFQRWQLKSQLLPRPPANDNSGNNKKKSHWAKRKTKKKKKKHRALIEAQMRKMANEALSAKHWQPIGRDDAFPGFDSWHFSRVLGSHHWRGTKAASVAACSVGSPRGGPRKPLCLHKSNHGTKMTTRNKNGSLWRASIREVIELLSK